MGTTLASTDTTSRSLPAARARRFALALATLGALAAGFRLGWPAAPATADADLLPVLRFMAALKGLMALAAWWAADWRLRRPAPAGVTLAAVAGCALMAGGPGLIWGLRHVLLGGALTYAGLACVAAAGWADRAAIAARLADLARTRQRRVTGSATSFRRSGGKVQGGS